MKLPHEGDILVTDMPITLQESAALVDLFTYHAPTPEQTKQLELVNAAASSFARMILEACPRSADRTAAIRLVREARMTANASIVLEGRNLP